MEKYMSIMLPNDKKITIGQILELTCQELSYEGLGTTRINNKPILVSNFYPNEVAKVKITKVYAKYCVGIIVEMLQYSKHRANKQFTNLDAMPLANLNYQAQLEFKQRYLNSLFKRNFAWINLKEIIEANQVFNYRNKAKFLLLIVNNKLSLASYLKDANDLSYDTSNLSLNNLELNKVLELILLTINNFYNYNDKLMHLNFFKTILIRINHLNLVQVGFELEPSYDLPKNLINELFLIDNLIEIYVLKNNQYLKLASKDQFQISLLNKTFNLNLNSFFQVNSEIAFKMFTLVKEINHTKYSKVLDLFCGVGIISNLIAKDNQEVLGIDITKEAINDAQRYVLNNNLKHKYIAKDIFKSQHILNTFIDQNTLSIIDPPRSGLNTKLINYLSQNNINTLIYISCNPRTLVRDLKDFLNNGYSINWIQPFDMFPNTAHIECVALLTK